MATVIHAFICKSSRVRKFSPMFTPCILCKSFVKLILLSLWRVFSILSLEQHSVTWKHSPPGLYHSPPGLYHNHHVVSHSHIYDNSTRWAKETSFSQTDQFHNPLVAEWASLGPLQGLRDWEGPDSPFQKSPFPILPSELVPLPAPVILSESIRTCTVT